MTAYWKPGASLSRGVERADEHGPIVDRKLSHLPIGAQREALPIYRHRKGLLFALENYRSVVIVGETGCGKTTQVSTSESLGLNVLN